MPDVVRFAPTVTIALLSSPDPIHWLSLSLPGFVQDAVLKTNYQLIFSEVVEKLKKGRVHKFSLSPR